MTVPKKTAMTALPQRRVRCASREPFKMVISFGTALTCSFARRNRHWWSMARRDFVDTFTYSLLSASIGARWAARLAG
jgi:hypothetical protein